MINRSKFTNSECTQVVSTGPEWNEWGACGKPVYVRTLSNGETIRMDTPYCETHCEEFHAGRMLDLEASMGN